MVTPPVTHRECVQHPDNNYDEVNGRVREGRGREERNNSGNVDDGLTGEESGDERGFEYTTTANIARHLRSDVTGSIYYVLLTTNNCVMIMASYPARRRCPD